MITPRVNACYYPTTVVIIDDHNEFLNAMRLELAENTPCYSFNQPHKALAFLSDYHFHNNLADRCIKEHKETDLDSVSLYVDIRSIHKAIYNPNRFSELAVLVSDYAMPGMNGLELLQNQTDNHLKKIMLTGAIGYPEAVQAFNDGTIHKFIMKDSVNLAEKLRESIHELTLNYFWELTESIFNESSQISKKLLTLFKEPEFISLFNKLLRNNKIVEYYLLDEHGSFLMLDAQAKPSWLIVKDDKDMQDLYEYAAQQDAPETILDVLKNKTMIPYFHTDEDLQKPFNECEDCLHPAQQLKGKQIYYYCYIANPKAYKLEYDKVLSFDQYRNGLI